MSDFPKCPQCNSENTYDEGAFLVCPDCGNEWEEKASSSDEVIDEEYVVRDAYGTVLQDGDFITIIKDLKVKGASSSLKVGTKVKIIRLVHGDHNIDCKIEGFGSMQLKSEFVKKA
jgi:protein PhnA